MTVKNVQLESPFTVDDKTKLDSVQAGAEPQPATATQSEAEAGLDNVKMMTPLRVAEAIASLAQSTAATYLSEMLQNDSGGTLDALTLVTQNSLGKIELVDPSVEADVKNIVGVLLASTAQGATGEVVSSGFITNVTTSFVIGDVLYLGKDAALTTTVPDIGVAGFAADDFVIRVGKITANATNSLHKNFSINIEVIGSL